MEINDVNSAFKDFFIHVDGEPVEVNAIGVLRNGDKDYVVLTDMEGFIEADEYHIVELLVKEGGQSLFQEIEDYAFYSELCDVWENLLERMEDASIDS